MNYDWLKPGVRVRIKTVEEIEAMYGDQMPYDLTEDMHPLCGTTQIVDEVTSAGAWVSEKCKLCVRIDSWSWPETVLLAAKTPKGNSLQ